MKLKVLPYKPYSASAKLLVATLGRDKAILKRNNTPAKRNNVILNWGNSRPGFVIDRTIKVINSPQAVHIASDKLLSLRKMKEAGVSVPEFTTDINVAKAWIADTYKVVCRTLLRANSGRGIVLATLDTELVRAPLYTRFLRNTTEFRVHVMNGEVIDYVRKRARSGYDANPSFNRYIRSYNNGWIMARESIARDVKVTSEAIKAVRALGLEFGAVDVVLQEKRGETKAYVLETNTAPGITGTTLTSYVAALKRFGYVR